MTRWHFDSIRPRWRQALFWLSLLLAISFVALSFRYQMPEDHWCAKTVEAKQDRADWQATPLPLRRTPSFGQPEVLQLRVRLAAGANDGSAQSLYLGEATPFAKVWFNGIDLTPEITLSALDRRVLAPQLIAIPTQLLASGDNQIDLSLPVDHRLSEARVSLLCLGPTEALVGAWRWNWWHQVGVPWICLSLLASMLLIGMLSFRLFERNQSMLWFAAVVLLAFVRVAYLGLSEKPGTPLLWRTFSDLSMIMLIYALYRLIVSLWPPRRWWLDRLLLIWMLLGAGLMLLTLVWPWHLLYPRAQTTFWLLVAGSAMTLVWAMAGALSKAHPVEWRRIMWALLFGASISAMEAATYTLPMAKRLIWTYPVGITAIVIAFGTLLVRRAVLGMNVLHRAAGVLAEDLDRALTDSDRGFDLRVVDELKQVSAEGERQRMLRDIHDGFGSRLVSVLARLRREQPDSALCRDMQRALVDLRLMIDALDESARALDVAFAMLRHRLQNQLDALGLQVDWQLQGVPTIQVDDRRKLMQLFRCIEELISNAVQHAKASRLTIAARYEQGWLEISVQDDGCGLAPGLSAGRGLHNIRRRLHTLEGSIRQIDGLDGRGTGMALRVPRM